MPRYSDSDKQHHKNKSANPTCCIPRQHVLCEPGGVLAQEQVHVLAAKRAERHRHLDRCMAGQADETLAVWAHMFAAKRAERHWDLDGNAWWGR